MQRIHSPSTVGIRTLTEEQHEVLDRMHPDIRVIGWDVDGPILQFPGGTYMAIRPTGLLGPRLSARMEA